MREGERVGNGKRANWREEKEREKEGEREKKERERGVKWEGLWEKRGPPCLENKTTIKSGVIKGIRWRTNNGGIRAVLTPITNYKTT